jgi:tetratricopeptide (TPR) repeat protein
VLTRHKRKTLERIKAEKFDAALLSATKWAKLEQSPEAIYALALCHSKTGNHLLAARHLEELLKLEETHRDAIALLALARYQLRDFTQARQLLNRINQLGGELSEQTLLVLADLCMRFKEYRQARDYGERLVVLKPDNASYWLPLANMYHYCHQTDQAENACRKVLELTPNNFGACYALSQYQQAKPDKNNLELFEKAYRANAGNSQAEFFLGTALAKEHEDLNHFDEAFRWMDTAMSARRSQISEDQVLQERKLLTDVREAFLTIERPAGGGHPSARPLFILGMPRTGTTLLEQIIGALDGVHVAGELDDFDIALWDQLNPQKTATSLNEAYLQNARRLNFTRLGSDYVDSVSQRIGDCRYFIDKKPQNFITAGYIALALPRAKIICLQRDSMDTCFANFKQAFGGPSHLYSYRQEDTARYYLAYVALMAFWKAQFPDRILEVSYEDLATNTEATAKRVLDYLGLDWDPQCLAFYKQPRISGSASSEQIRRPVYTSSIGRWKHFGSQLQPMRQALAE